MVSIGDPFLCFFNYTFETGLGSNDYRSCQVNVSVATLISMHIYK